ncbi:hypothetical protein AOQ84DRAFT_388562 [Glonium stellatum]|uniref:Uncharacterized protein n=1 Tax=Glonium stellatum TaxID=574774 RepID=A0A8E2F1H4_9PEZI|nr:hypothetical protein AOQ84DRAFT_388562 [Glonium stellatum]
MSRSYSRSQGRPSRQPSWEIEEPPEIVPLSPVLESYYDDPRLSPPTRPFQFEEYPRHGSISSQRATSPKSDPRSYTGRVRFETPTQYPRFTRSRSRDSEEQSAINQVKQFENDRRLNLELDYLREELRAKERERRINGDLDEYSSFTPPISSRLPVIREYSPTPYSRRRDSVAAPGLHLRGNSPAAVRFQDELSSDSDIEESYDEESDTESSSSFGFIIPGGQKDGSSQNAAHENGPSAASIENQGLMQEKMTRISRHFENKTMHKIIRSRLSNLGEEGEEMEIELNAGQDINPESNTTLGPLFRWIHLHGETMDFDDFLEVAIQSPELAPDEKDLIKRHLKRLRNFHEKPLVTPMGYQGRYMEPVVLQDLTSQVTSSKAYLDTGVIALCLPYFLLDEYSPNSEFPNSTKHPTRSLLQSSISSTAQERDMRQAVCKAPATQPGHCFHVSQLWCLILNDKLMVTCAKVNFNELCGGSVTVHSQPISAYPHIQVSDGGNCLWQIGLDECQTWFAFTANFMEIKSSQDGFMSRFEERFRVTMKGKTVTAKNWPQILAQAQDSVVRLFIYRKKPSKNPCIITENVGREDDGSSSESEQVFPWQMEHMPPPPDLAQAVPRSFKPGTGTNTASQNSQTPDSPEITKDNVKPEPKVAPINEFHVFSWMSAQRLEYEATDNLQQPEMKGDVLNEKEIKANLDGTHEILLSNANHKEMKAYQDCREKRLPEVVKFLALITNVNGQFAQGISVADKFFIAATEMYELFIPLDIETIVGLRYWGAVYYILKRTIPRNQRVLMESIEKFILVARLARVIKEELSGTSGLKPEHAELPQELQKAWLHCITYLVLFRVRVKNVRDIDRHIEMCQLLLYRGRRNLARKLTKIRLEKKEVAVPQIVLSVLISRLLKSVTPDPDQLDLYRTYWEYWEQLEAEVRTHRIERAQPQINDLQQEITAVIKTLEHQLNVLERLHDEFLAQRAGWSYLNNNDRKHEVHLIKECISQMENRIQGFSEMRLKADELEIWNTQKIASTKDRQDKAIYAFTIVTIIFLPLSFVSGFLGMNTTDIRNTNVKQWVFWASGLPLTAAVILIALMWAGELGNAWRAITNFFPTRKRGSGYVQIRDRPRKWHGFNAAKKKKHIPSPTPVLAAPAAPSRAPKPYRRTATYRSVV